jgi:hypothetical protein
MGLPSPYLAICAIYYNVAPYLREWIEFHRLVGVERFFLYDHASDDDHLEVLRPYLDDGSVVLHDWPHYPGGQVEAYDDCLREHRDDARWIAFIDSDEFLFSPTGQPLPEVLRDYERWPGVVVNWVMFGTSGHHEKPNGLVIESFVRRGEDLSRDRAVKSIVDPKRTLRSTGSPHCFVYDGFAVDELERPIDRPFGFTPSTTLTRLRINHYFTKSEQEFLTKLGQPPAHPDRRRSKEANFARLEQLNAVRDEEILRFLPELRDALARSERPLERERGD